MKNAGRTLGAAVVAVGGLWAPALATAQALATGGEATPPVLRIFAVFVICALIALVTAIALRRFSSGAITRAAAMAALQKFVGERKISVLETRRVSPHADVCRLVCAEMEYVLVVTPGGATVLRESACEPTRETGAP